MFQRGKTKLQKNIFLLCIVKKMNEEIWLLGNTGIDKHTFHDLKNQFWIDAKDNDKILIPNKVSFGQNGYKYFMFMSQ